MRGRLTLTKVLLSSKLADLALNARGVKENCEQQGLNPGSPRTLCKQERSITQHFRQVSYQAVRSGCLERIDIHNLKSIRTSATPAWSLDLLIPISTK